MREIKMTRRVLTDPDFGQLIIKENIRARNIILYARKDGIHITVPPGVLDLEIIKAVERFRGRLLRDSKKVERKKIDLDYKIDSPQFKLRLIPGTLNKFLAKSTLGSMEIICPPDADFEDEELQLWLVKVIEEALRRNAKQILPNRLNAWSRRLDLPYESVKINSSKGRWGSCSTKKTINLSYYLILLPVHLTDYVLIHELCHTREMNHSDKFWALMDHFTDGKAQSLRAELRKYKTELL